MNRKKAILMATGLETCLLTIFLVLYVSGTIKMTTFAIGVGTMFVIMSAVIAIIVLKLPPM